MNDKCDELFLDDFIVCNEAHSGVYVTRRIRKKRWNDDRNMSRSCLQTMPCKDEYGEDKRAITGLLDKF